MTTDLMAGYVAYTNAQDIVAEADNGTGDMELQSVSVTVSVTISWTRAQD